MMIMMMMMTMMILLKIYALFTYAPLLYNSEIRFITLYPTVSTETQPMATGAYTVYSYT